jgi:hypothetical protein
VELSPTGYCLTRFQVSLSPANLKHFMCKNRESLR